MPTVLSHIESQARSVPHEEFFLMLANGELHIIGEIPTWNWGVPSAHSRHRTHRPIYTLSEINQMANDACPGTEHSKVAVSALFSPSAPFYRPCFKTLLLV